MRNRHDNHPGAELWYSKIASIQEFPIGPIPKILKAPSNPRPVFLKNRIEESPDILDHNGFWTDSIDNFECGGKEISLILLPKLLSSHRKRWTGKARSEEIDLW
jgi:hypothetical protein